MRYHLIRILLGVIVTLASRRRDVRRYLSRMDGHRFALKVHGVARPLMVRVAGNRLRLADNGKCPAEISASMGTFLKIFCGRLDADAAFFQRKIRFSGSLPEAMRLKILMDFLIL